MQQVCKSNQLIPMPKLPRVSSRDDVGSLLEAAPCLIKCKAARTSLILLVSGAEALQLLSSSQRGGGCRSSGSWAAIR
jgi:hypothetical protein